MALSVRALRRGADDRARHDHRERGAALDPGRPVFRQVAGLGGQCVPAHLRRVPAARRAPWRPFRPAPAVSARHYAVLACIAFLRHGELAGIADRGARGPRARRRSRDRGRAFLDHEHFQRGRRTRTGDGSLRLRLRQRREHRRTGGGLSDQLAELALGISRESADRRRRIRPVPDAAAARSQRFGIRSFGRRRRRNGNRLVDAGDLCDRQRQRRRLDLRANDRNAGWRRAAARALSRHSRRGRATP